MCDSGRGDTCAEAGSTETCWELVVGQHGHGGGADSGVGNEFGELGGSGHVIYTCRNLIWNACFYPGKRFYYYFQFTDKKMEA